MSRHRRRRQARQRARRRRLGYLLAQALLWRARLGEFPGLVDDSPELSKLRHTMRRAELGVIEGFERTFVGVDYGKRDYSVRVLHMLTATGRVR